MTSRSSARPSSPGTGYLSTAFDSERLTIKESLKPRKLIVCIDGTSNQYSDKNTNVIELYSHIVKSDTQLTYYNSGIGTYAKPSWRSWSYMKQVVSNGIDLAIAWNLEKVIIGAYRWLSDNYRPGDQIFLFGFSRGAYQVRAIAGMIASVGLIFPGNQEQIPFAFELYADYIGDTGDEAGNSIWLNPAQEAIGQSKQKVDTFRKTFSRPSVDIHFLGAWYVVADRSGPELKKGSVNRDTVSSIGIRRGKLLPLTNSCEHIKHFRHALALDERRVKFLPEHVQHPRDGQVDENHIKEVWFAGTHSDIGGGNTRNIELNRGTEPLVWMMNEAEDVGLVVDSKNLGDGVKRAQVIPSLTGVWWLLEVMPLARLAYGSDGKRVISRPHLGRGRKISENHKLHYSVLANYLQVENQKRYKPYAKYKTSGINGRKMEWEAMFREAESQELAENHTLRWEGDRRIIEVLRIIREADGELATSGDPDQRGTITWLRTVSRLVDDDACAKMIWEYGSLRFLLKVANFEQDALVREIIRAVVGMPNGLYQGNQHSQTKSTLSVQTMLSPVDYEMNIPFPSAPQDDANTNLKIVQDVIPRLPDLLNCYKRSERKITIDPGLANRSNQSAFAHSIQVLNEGKNNLWARIRKMSVSNKPPPLATRRAPSRSFAHDIAAADVVHHLVPLLTLKPPSPEATVQFRRLILRTLDAITKLALGDEVAGSKFYSRHTASKIIALMNDDIRIIKAALRALAALAADDRFVEALKRSLSGPDSSLVAQAIETIATIAEDETIDAYLVKKKVIPQILPVIPNAPQTTGKRGAVQALRRLCHNDAARSQLYDHGAIGILQPLMKSSPDAIAIIESLAIHDEARHQMIQDNTLDGVVSLMESNSRSTSQRAIYVVAAFCRQADGRKEVLRKGMIQKLVPMLRGDSALCDVLEVVTRLAQYDDTRSVLLEYQVVEELLEALKRQRGDVENRASDGLYIYPTLGNMRFPPLGEFDDESTVMFTKTLDTISKIAQYDDIRYRMMDLQLIEVLLELGLGTPRVMGKHLSSPVVPEDINRSQEVMKCFGSLVAYG
ncbi:hypothetical protein FRC07_001110 [Ceratobasidium sp. 392]|nr:hypothetical protein FRC07_001110 [Ceratobasidium sp. 392]